MNKGLCVRDSVCARMSVSAFTLERAFHLKCYRVHTCAQEKNHADKCVVRLLCPAATIQRWRTCCVRINGVCTVDTSWAVAWQKQLQCGFRPEACNIARQRQSRSEWRARAFSWMITLHIAFSFKFNGLGPPSSRIWRIRPRKILKRDPTDLAASERREKLTFLNSSFDMK
jgi:hypothetical protein